jgi:hypothetical protein
MPKKLTVPEATTEQASAVAIAPIRLCCMERHFGAVCSDGKVMCLMCFRRVDYDQLAVSPSNEVRWDVCKDCYTVQQPDNQPDNQPARKQPTKRVSGRKPAKKVARNKVEEPVSA